MYNETMSPKIKEITCLYIKEVTFDFVMTSGFGCYGWKHYILNTLCQILYYRQRVCECRLDSSG